MKACPTDYVSNILHIESCMECFMNENNKEDILIFKECMI